MNDCNYDEVFTRITNDMADDLMTWLGLPIIQSQRVAVKLVELKKALARLSFRTSLVDHVHDSDCYLARSFLLDSERLDEQVEVGALSAQQGRLHRRRQIEIQRYPADVLQILQRL